MRPIAVIADVKTIVLTIYRHRSGVNKAQILFQMLNGRMIAYCHNTILWWFAHTCPSTLNFRMVSSQSSFKNFNHRLLMTFPSTRWEFGANLFSFILTDSHITRIFGHQNNYSNSLNCFGEKMITVFSYVCSAHSFVLSNNAHLIISFLRFSSLFFGFIF